METVPFAFRQEQPSLWVHALELQHQGQGSLAATASTGAVVLRQRWNFWLQKNHGTSLPKKKIPLIFRGPMLLTGIWYIKLHKFKKLWNFREIFPKCLQNEPPQEDGFYRWVRTVVLGQGIWKPKFELDVPCWIKCNFIVTTPKALLVVPPSFSPAASLATPPPPGVPPGNNC